MQSNDFSIENALSPQTNQNNKVIGCVLCFAVVGSLIYIILCVGKEHYQDWNEKLRRENDETMMKYKYQAIPQKDAKKSYSQYLKTFKQPTELAQKYNALKANNLLPMDKESEEWARANPQGRGSLELKNMLSAGTFLGINTQGSSMKNANLQIRSEPANPIVPISVFNNSTITPDIYRKELEIGECSDPKVRN